jgi:CDP-glucose 4,6-dehydratase
MFNNIYKNKKVFITGHSGFCGTWLTTWLLKLGADVCGYSLDPNTNPNHFSLLNMQEKSNLKNWICDIRSLESLKHCIGSYEPDIVFHLAAEPLVKQSYLTPMKTFEVNTIGTLNLLEACRDVKSIKAILIITTDKVYENLEQGEKFKETDRLGAHDPYSTSKSCAELITESYKKSFYDTNTLISTVRAGNIIGGGDWAQDRLIPDLIKATINNKEVEIRNPNSTRPWQHILDAISGYLLLGEKLLNNEKTYEGAWNFAPVNEEAISVKKVINYAKQAWIKIQRPIVASIETTQHEATSLQLDSTKAWFLLSWTNKFATQQAVEWTIEWYKEFYENNKIITMEQLEKYEGL